MMDARGGIALAAVAASTPLTIDVGGYHVGAVSLVLGLLSVALTRAMLAARDAHTTSPLYNLIVSALALIVMFALLVERNPGPGLAVAWGAGVGVSIVLLVDVFGERMVAMFRAMLGKE